MLELFPEGFEEVDHADGVELVAYTDPAGEERLWQVFGGVRAEDVDADWRERWKGFHRPVRVGKLWIGPSWHDPPPDATPIVIDPGRAFGTGGHPTTQLCIELLLEEEPSDLVDLGCGSGVLAVVSAKLGFDPVLAFDIDRNAVAATTANAVANDVSVDAQVADILTGTLPATELGVANITHGVLQAVAPRLHCRRLISSGYLPTDSVECPPLRHVRRITRDGWAADVYEVPQPAQ